MRKSKPTPAGRVLRVLKRIAPQPGKDIVLSLDANLQPAAEAALAGRRGAVVAIEPKTGGVLALVSQPSFDPNLFVTGISFKKYRRAARVHRPCRCTTACCTACIRRVRRSSRWLRSPVWMPAW